MVQAPLSLSEPLLPAQEDAPPPLPLSKNVPLLLIYSGFAYAGRSLWSGSVLSALLFLLHHDARTVGTLSALMGMCQLVSSLLAGYAADAGRRDRVLRLSTALGVAASAVTVCASLRPSRHAMAAALCAWGLFWGTASTSVSALFADSVSDGSRSKYFTLRSQVQKAGIMVGPAVAAILFYKLGDDWTVEKCSRVMLIGQLVGLPGCLVLWFVRDEFVEKPAGTGTDSALDSHSTESLSSAEDCSVSDDSDVENIDQSDLCLSLNSNPSPRERCCNCGISERRTVPILVASADVCAGLAAGISTRYFPVFFLRNLGLDPIHVQLLYIASPALQIVLSHGAHLEGRRVGRLQTAARLRLVGAAIFGGMIWSYVRGAPAWVVCALYLADTGFTNCTQALTRSALMDSVPQKERARWSALESVNMFSWSGSAAVGGYLVGVEGIVFNFCVTAVLQLVATLPLIYLCSRRGGERLEARQ